jgi:hypothetical protein
MNKAHLRAVFLMLAGENVAAVFSAQSGICRTSLYKLLRRRPMSFAVKSKTRLRIKTPLVIARPPASECISETIRYKNGFQSHITK